ncbi:MAG: S1 RNA-binding domain-containing protein, partial [Chloroflexia bacterium]|nr:S1 RNA-binding domain-containing protein [Chloroflexia bacterium]
PKGEGWSFFVESLRPGQKLPLRIRIDDYLFEKDIAPRIPFTYPRDVLAGWLHHCHAFSQAIIADEQNFYHAYGPSELVAFYDDLARQAATIQPRREALIQLAWGTGWQSKTIGMHLAKEEMEMVRQTFRLGRAGVNEFPKTRRLIERGGNPSAPLGWIRLRLADHMPEAPVPPTTNVTELRSSQPERSNVSQHTPVTSGTPPRTLADLRPGMILEGTVTRITAFGAFINVGVGRDGLLHISQISTKRIEHANAMLSIGQRVRVKVHHVDVDQRKLGLTMRDLQQPEEL